jgi:hypothetical protein
VNVIKFKSDISAVLANYNTVNVIVMVLNNMKVLNPQKNIYTIRIISDDTLCTFKSGLSYEVWEEVFADNDVDTIFNNVLTTYRSTFYHCFPLKKFIKANKK